MRTLARTSLLLAFVVLLVAPTQAAAIDRTIVVKGSATQEVPNDTASLGFSVSKERTSKAAALRIASIRMREVIAVAQATPGVTPGDVITGQVSVRKVNRKGKAHWTASQSIRVILHQPDRAGDLIAGAVAAGATGTSGPNFFPGDPEAAYANVLLAAFDQAKGKAAALAARAGAILGPVLSIEEGSEVIPSEPRSVKKGASGDEVAPPVKPGGSTVTGTVRVVFSLE